MAEPFDLSTDFLPNMADISKDWLSEAAELRKQLDIYQAAELAMADALAKKKLKDLGDESAAALKAEADIAAFKEKNADARAAMESGRISTLLTLTKNYLASVATEEEAIAGEAELQKIKSLQTIQNVKIRMLRDEKAMQESGIADALAAALSSNADIVAAGKEALKSIAQIEENNAVRRGQLHDLQQKNMMAQADWLANQEEILANKKEQNIARLQELSLQYEMANANEANDIEFAIAESQIQFKRKALENDKQLKIAQANELATIENTSFLKLQGYDQKRFDMQLALKQKQADEEIDIEFAIEEHRLTALDKYFEQQKNFKIKQLEEEAALEEAHRAKVAKGEEDLFDLKHELLQLHKDRDFDIEQTLKANRIKVEKEIFEQEKAFDIKVKEAEDKLAENSYKKILQYQDEEFDAEQKHKQMLADDEIDKEHQIKQLRQDHDDQLFKRRQKNQVILANLAELALDELENRIQDAEDRSTAAALKIAALKPDTSGMTDEEKAKIEAARAKTVTDGAKAENDERMAGFAETELNAEIGLAAARARSTDEAYKADAISAKLSSMRTAAFDEANEAEIDLAVMRAAASDEEIQAQKKRKSIVDQINQNESRINDLRLKAAAANDPKLLTSNRKTRREMKQLEKDEANRNAFEDMLNADPSDENYSSISMQYQAEVANLESQKGDDRFKDDSGNFSQELFDAEMALIEKKYDYESDAYKEYMELRAYEDDKAAAKKNKENVLKNFKKAFDPGTMLAAAMGSKGAAGSIAEAKKELFYSADEHGNLKFDQQKAFDNLMTGLSSVLKSLENKMKDIGKYQAPIDTRLYGSKASFKSAGGLFMALTAASPVLLQKDMLDSLQSLVSQGIAHNVQLRAYLDTASKKIATTFEVADGTLLKLVRIQQADTTMARLGMESALNAFLNNMYETTEYLTSLADSVRQNLYEAQALMEAKDATEFEFQVQKWLGSMHSVGMSDEAVSSISTALGQLAAGQIEALTGGGAGNLLVMAANKAEGVSLGEVLQDGLDSEQTNKLLKASVEYLAEIANRSESKVVRQELAKIFGVTAADLKAITNMADEKTMKAVTEKNLGFGGMMAETMIRSLTMVTRTSMAEMLDTVWENVQSTMAFGMANNPVSYLLFKTATLLEEATGGIDLPFLNVYGFGVDLNMSVAQLMQIAAMSGGILTGLSSMLSGLGQAGANFLDLLGATPGLTKVARGNGSGSGDSGSDTSMSGLVGGDGGSMKDATMAEAAQQMADLAKQGKEENEDATRDDIIDVIEKLFKILFEKIDINTNAVKLTPISIGDAINGTNKAEEVHAHSWTNPATYSAYTTRSKF